MNRALLALFTRALREDVRAKSMYWARAGLVCIVLANLGITHLSSGWVGAPGLVFFDSVIGINLFFISLAGLSYFSSAITEEKEEMTLGLLRMTNLNPLSILLGKSASRQVGSLLLLVSQLPFTLLAVALGGVTLSQIVAAYACLAAYALFLGNVALFFSVMARRTVLAAILTGATLFLFLFGAWIIRQPILWTLKFFHVIPSEQPGPRLDAFLTGWETASPIARIGEIGVTGFNGGPIGFQVVSNVILGLVFFLGAWAIFDIFCNEQADSAPARGLLSKRVKRLLVTKTPGGSWLRVLFLIFVPGRVWRRALLWKDYHFLGGGHALVIGKLVAYGCLLGTVVLVQHRFNTSGIDAHKIGYIAIWTMLFALTIEGAFITARVFRQERIWKTWSSLAMLPMSTRRIAYQKILGCLIASWPAMLLFALGCTLVADDIFREIAYEFRNASYRDDSIWMVLTGFAFAVLQVLLFYHLVADLSLRLKWGALPLSIAVCYIGTTFMVGIAFLMFRQAAFVVLDVGLALLIGMLHVDIGRRLNQLAAED